jgi:hypothetical protein
LGPTERASTCVCVWTFAVLGRLVRTQLCFMGEARLQLRDLFPQLLLPFRILLLFLRSVCVCVSEGQKKSKHGGR